MSKITHFDKPTARHLSTLAAAELQALAAKHGLAVSYTGGVLGGQFFDMELRFACLDNSGVAVSPEAEAFKLYYKSIGMPADALGQEFTFGGKPYILRGYKPGSPKFAFVAERVADGKTYRLTFEGVKRAFANKDATPTSVKKNSTPSGFTKGQPVMARWSDGKMYEATYIKVGVRPGFHRVKFPDVGTYGSSKVQAV